MRSILWSTLLAAACLLLAPSCASTRGAKAGAGEPEVLRFEPVLVTPGGKEELELAGMNDEELFALGTSSFAAQDYEKAARCFGRLADTFPASKHRADAAFNAGLSLERLSKFADAAERFKPLADPAKGTGDSLDAAFRLAECYYHLDQYAPAIEILNVVAGREDISSQKRLEAKVHKGICQLESGELDAAETSLRDSLNYWSEKKEADRLDEYFPGQAQFFLGEIYRIFYERVELDPEQGEDKLGKDLENKCEMLLSAQGHYLRAIRIGEGQWATAAGFRIGALYEDLYDAMLNAKVPPGLDADQQQIYREELHKKVRVLVTKAMSIYERTLAAAERIGAENPFIAKTRESLDRLKQILLDSPDVPAAAPAATEPSQAKPAEPAS
ncbi:MAG: tetratricopeptide repeat protein [Myxococcales bacterium]